MPAKNVSASVRQRLLNLAKERGKRFNDVLQHYAQERWLYRLSRSEHSSRFILKGALMLTAWHIPVNRPTRDIDLLARASNDPETIRDMIAAIPRRGYSGRQDQAPGWHAAVAELRCTESSDAHNGPRTRR